MKYSNYIVIAAFIIAVIIFFIVVRKILVLLSNNYVKRNRERLFDSSYPLSGECMKLSDKMASNISKFNEYIDDLGLNQEYECSSSVVSNAEKKKVKYLIKYSDVSETTECLSKLDFCIDFLKTMEDFWDKTDQLSGQLRKKLPLFIRMFATFSKLAFFVCDLGKSYEKLEYPVFTFSYVSPAGESWRELPIQITSKRLSKVQNELSLKMSKVGHIKAQRIAMTNDLREAIKKRDSYTCCICGNSVFSEPNLLLEVDHIIPVSKGGVTEASNLQTLCWRCNRAKGDK